MKKATRFSAIVIMATALFFSCNKEQSAINTGAKSNISLIRRIEAINEQYANVAKGKDKENTVLGEVNKKLAAELAIVDAGAAAAAALTPPARVPIVGPYYVLWVGFEASRIAEPTLRKAYETKKLDVPSGNTRAGEFNFGPLGNAHNDLMLAASDAEVDVTISNGHFNNNVRSLVTTHYYFGNADLTTFYDDNESSMVSLVSYTQGFVSSTGVDVTSMINNFAGLNQDTKTIMNTIHNGMDDLEATEATNYLLEVQAVIAPSSTLSTDDKESLLTFIAVLNSSYHLWFNNIIE